MSRVEVGTKWSNLSLVDKVCRFGIDEDDEVELGGSDQPSGQSQVGQVGQGQPESGQVTKVESPKRRGRPKVAKSDQPSQVSQGQDDTKSSGRNAWRGDKEEYNVWMSKRSYYRKMVKKYAALVNGPDQTKVGLAKLKLAEYQEMEKQSDIAIEAARVKYGINKRGGSKKVLTDEIDELE